MHPVADLLICLRFFSRLPLPVTQREIACGAQGLASAAAMVPVAGAFIGLMAGLVIAVALTLGLPPLLAASIAVAALVAFTGALHEDGLADCADGFGGGRTVERKLEIMRDSRIGTFGTCAVALSLLIRTAAIGALAARSPLTCAAAIIVSAALSRTACLMPLVLLPAARAEGLGASAGRPKASQVLAAATIAIGLALGSIPFGFGVARVTIDVAVAFLAAAAVSGLARGQIQGHTGDVAGAAQQAAEMAVLAVFAAS